MGLWYTWRSAIIAASGTALYGYDSAVIASTQVLPLPLHLTPLTLMGCSFAQQGFLEYFAPSNNVIGYRPVVGNQSHRMLTSFSAVVSSYYGGVILGLGVVVLICDRFSRKYTIQLGGLIGLIGAILQAASIKISMFIVGRVIAGIASGIMLTTVSVYQSKHESRLRGAWDLDRC